MRGASDRRSDNQVGARAKDGVFNLHVDGLPVWDSFWGVLVEGPSVSWTLKRGMLGGEGAGAGVRNAIAPYNERHAAGFFKVQHSEARSPQNPPPPFEVGKPSPSGNPPRAWV